MAKIEPRTKEEVKAEIAALKAAKSKVRKTNHFGDNLHDAIDAQVVVLENGLTEDEVRDRFEDEDDPDNRNELDAALDAFFWMEGEEREYAEHDSLAAGWVDIGLE